jgi:hypothetical protein
VAVAARLPDRLGADLLGTARTAFTQALELTALISALVVLVTAIVAARLLAMSAGPVSGPASKPGGRTIPGSGNRSHADDVIL